MEDKTMMDPDVIVEFNALIGELHSVKKSVENAKSQETLRRAAKRGILILEDLRTEVVHRIANRAGIEL